MTGDPRDRLRELLVYLHEDLDVKLKDWLDPSSEEDKANLAQAILAIANHGGGYVVLGVRVAIMDGSFHLRRPLPAFTRKISSMES
jgi:hypothetical protein